MQKIFILIPIRLLTRSNKGTLTGMVKGQKFVGFKGYD